MFADSAQPDKIRSTVTEADAKQDGGCMRRCESYKSRAWCLAISKAGRIKAATVLASWSHILQHAPGTACVSDSITSKTPNMTSTDEYYQHYRASSIGDALIETLNDMVTSNRVSGELAMKVLTHFDCAIAEALESDATATIKMEGHMDTYNRVDDVFTFLLKDVTFETREAIKGRVIDEFTTPLVKVVACEAKKAKKG